MSWSWDAAFMRGLYEGQRAGSTARVGKVVGPDAGHFAGAPIRLSDGARAAAEGAEWKIDGVRQKVSGQKSEVGPTPHPTLSPPSKGAEREARWIRGALAGKDGSGTSRSSSVQVRPGVFDRADE